MRAAVLLALTLTALSPGAAARRGEVLRVCADPNNYPLSDRDGAGFENRIAEVIADELGATVEYTWHAQRRRFFRETLKAKRCDVVIGVPADLEMVRTTRPYYRSAYALVSRADAGLDDLTSLADPRLATLRVAVQTIGDDGANAPPAHALAARGVIDNVVGYSVFGDYGAARPGAPIVDAVADGEVDVAIVWGPLAGPLARDAATALRVTPLAEAEDGGFPMAFSIAMGVRHPDRRLARRLDRALRARRADLEAILDEFEVPRVEASR